MPRPDAGIRLQAKTTRTPAAIICSSNSRRTPERIHKVACVFIARPNGKNYKVRMTKDQMTNDPGFFFVILGLCFFHRSCFVIPNRSACNRRRSTRYFARDAGNVVRCSEPPFSTTIQFFRYRDANFCIFAASLVECAGLRFRTSTILARRGGVSNGVAECLV